MLRLQGAEVSVSAAFARCRIEGTRTEDPVTVDVRLELKSEIAVFNSHANRPFMSATHASLKKSDIILCGSRIKPESGRELRVGSCQMYIVTSHPDQNASL